MLNTLYQSLLQSILFCINHRSIPRSDSIVASVDIVFDIGGSQTCPLRNYEILHDTNTDSSTVLEAVFPQ